jgi:hypothetical protein
VNTLDASAGITPMFREWNAPTVLATRSIPKKPGLFSSLRLARKPQAPTHRAKHRPGDGRVEFSKMSLVWAKDPRSNPGWVKR